MYSANINVLFLTEIKQDISDTFLVELQSKYGFWMDDVGLTVHFVFSLPLCLSYGFCNTLQPYSLKRFLESLQNLLTLGFDPVIDLITLTVTFILNSDIRLCCHWGHECFTNTFCLVSRIRLGTYKTPICPWHGCWKAGQNLETEWCPINIKLKNHLALCETLN